MIADPIKAEIEIKSRLAINSPIQLSGFHNFIINITNLWKN